MRSRENYTPFIATGLALTAAILIVFQIYLFFEPTRIQSVSAADKNLAEKEGRKLYAENCASCHGERGEGKLGPALNSKGLLKTTPDELLFNLTRTGVPSTVMPAWGQPFGGPLTDQQVAHVVAFMRAWEPDAPEIKPAVTAPDPVRGATIFANACFVCHGENGQGSARVPAINDAKRLKDFDDAWYRDVIAHGRPAKGMPTWGTVLAPQQITDLVALIGAWRDGRAVSPAISFARHISNALYALRQFDRIDAAFYLSAAMALATKPQQDEIAAVMEFVKANRLSEAESRLLALLPPSEMGKEVYESNCAACHASDGSGGMGKNLRGNKFIKSKPDAELIAFLLAGRKGTAMNPFKGILTDEQLGYVIALMRTWDK